HDRAFGTGQKLRDIRYAWRFVFRVQQIVPFAIQTFATQLGEAGHAPDVGSYAPILLKKFLCFDDFTQNGAGAEQLHTLLGLATFEQAIHAPDDPFLVPFPQAGVRVVFVHHGAVVVDVFLVLDHALETIMDDDGQFMREGRVIRNAVRDHAGQDVAVAVLMLQPLSIERGPACRTTQQEAAGLHVAGCPGEVTHALEAEHGVIDEERNHDAVVRRVRRCRSNPRAERARFVNPFLQKLAILRFAVVHDLVFVDRHVLLPFGSINPNLAEQAFHAEGTGFVGQNRYHTRAKLLVTQNLIQNPDKGLGCGNFTAFSSRFQYWLEHLQARHGQGLIGLGATLGQVATESLAAFMQVLHLGGVFRRLEVRQFRQLFVRDRNIEAVAEFANGFQVELLLLVSRVLRLAHMAHAIALDGFGQNDGRLPGVIGRRVEGGI